MRWHVHGERSVYESDWVAVRLVDVEIPDDRRFEHHVVRLPGPAVGTVVTDAEGRVLLLWRHRFISDTWGWELPAGRVDAGEASEAAAVREVLEETGWQVGTPRRLHTYFPSNGLSDQAFELFAADADHEVGPPTDLSESTHRAWLTVEEVRREVARGQVTDGMSLTGLLWFLALEAPTGGLPVTGPLR